RDAPDMPELQEDHRTPGMHGVDDLAPAFDLRVGIDAGYARAAATARDHGRGLGDEEPALGGALRIVFSIERPRREGRLCRARPRQWRKHDTMPDLVRTDLERRKQMRKVHYCPENLT